MELQGQGIAPAGSRCEDTTLEDPTLFINRELSWIRFNVRVLEEAEDRSQPLLERVKFLAISGSNLDEFFMTRAALLEEQIDRDLFEPTPDGLTPLEQIEATRNEILPLLLRQRKCWEEGLLPELFKEGIRIHKFNDLLEDQKQTLRDYFKNVILPGLTERMKESAQQFIANLQINILVVANKPKNGETYFVVEIPTEDFGRFIEFPIRDEVSDNNGSGAKDFVFIEDLVGSNLDLLFPSMQVLDHYKFRVTRNAELDVKADESTDFLRTMEMTARQRRYGKPARLEFESSMPKHLRDYLTRKINVPRYAQYEVDDPLAFVDFWQFLKLRRPDLKDVPFDGYVVPELAPDKNVFQEVSAKDFALYHPYDSFDMIIDLLKKASTDPNVTDIYITLYRIDPNSPIVAALMAAVSNGKSVTVMVELKAKFDEINNVNWTKVMRQAGVNVVYNFPKIKVHAKLALIVRKENGKLAHYSHIGSGNYNAVTTRIYADIGYLTSNPSIGTEVFSLFQKLTKFPKEVENYKYLLVAPASLKNEILNRIQREIDRHKEKGGGYLAFKLNGLVDKNIIQALYRASQAGVKIDLNVRGLCCLRPGVPSISENIKVISIVGRFLEHARIYYFRNAGEEEVLLGSSDMMPRNLEKRVEVLFTIPDPTIKSSILENILMIHLKDNVKARRLLSDGTYERVKPGPGEEVVDSQLWLINNRGIWHDKKVTPA